MQVVVKRRRSSQYWKFDSEGREAHSMRSAQAKRKAYGSMSLDQESQDIQQPPERSMEHEHVPGNPFVKVERERERELNGDLSFQ